MNTPLWQYIPAELRARPQWAVAGPKKAPLAINGGDAKSTDPTTWASFDQAATVAYQRCLHIGYMLSADDPFTCIDLDWCNAESQARKGKDIDPGEHSTWADAERYCRIVRGFNSYTERSTYGYGLHIWVRGNIGVGCKLQGIEVYSQARFIVCTGDRLSHTNPNIEDRNDLVNAMVNDLRRDQVKRIDLLEVDAVSADQKIIDSAVNADNAAKFSDLCRGDWKKYGYPSQSEADLSLLSMLAFYTKSNDQVRRLFRATALGRRDKAMKNDRYINYTLRLIRGRMSEQASEAKLDGIAERMADQLLGRLKAQLR